MRHRALELAAAGAEDDVVRAEIVDLGERLAVARPPMVSIFNRVRRFLDRAWRAHGLRTPLPPFLCSVRLARRWVRAPRYGLDTLVRQLSIPPRPRHRALGDAEMTADLWHELLKRGKLADVHTLEALRAIGGVGRSRRRRSRRRGVARSSGP